MTHESALLTWMLFATCLAYIAWRLGRLHGVSRLRLYVGLGALFVAYGFTVETLAGGGAAEFPSELAAIGTSWMLGSIIASKGRPENLLPQPGNRGLQPSGLDRREWIRLIACGALVMVVGSFTLGWLS
jgi:hypothetical protein